MSIILAWPQLVPSSCSSLLPARSSLSLLRGRRELVLLPAATSRRKQRCRVVRAAEVEAAAADMAWASFPHLAAAGKQLMSDIAGSMQEELGPLLEHSLTPEDVRHFKNGQGNSEGSVILRAGKPGSKIKFVLRSWLHVEAPFGTLNIASLLAMLGPETDAPHFLFEFIQNGPNSLVVVLDLLPRKDLVLDTDYLKRIYEDSKLESIRAELEKAAAVQPYVSPSLFVRSIISPTALLLKFQGALPSGEPVEGGLDKLISKLLHPSAKEVFLAWLDTYRNKGHQPEGDEKGHLAKRDEKIRSQGVEVDLTSNMPRLFGQEITDRVVAAFLKGE